MAEIIWTESALIDLNEIVDYIALDKTTAAKHLVEKIFYSVERLEKHPRSGRKPPELADLKYREIIVGPCRIFYRINKQNVYILYVMRSERMLRNFLLDERYEVSE